MEELAKQVRLIIKEIDDKKRLIDTFKDCMKLEGEPIDTSQIIDKLDSSIASILGELSKIKNIKTDI